MQGLQNIYLSNLNAVCYDGGRYATKKGGLWSSYGTIKFAQSKLYYIFKGSCTIQIAGQEYIGSAGDWFLLPKNIPHSYENDYDHDFGEWWIHFEVFPDSDIFERLHLPYMLHAENRRRIELLFKKYEQTLKSRLVSDRLLVKAVLLEILAEYIKAAVPEEAETTGESSSRMDCVLQYIHDHVSDDISVAELAALIQMHPNHFIRFFKTHTGYTPAYYMKKVRMDIAKKLLEKSELNISEIAEKIGIHESTYFSKVFKESYSMSPKMYRAFFQNNPVEWVEQKSNHGLKQDRSKSMETKE